MYKRTAGLVLTGVLATGAIAAVAMTPASATTSDNLVTSRLAHIKSALSGLVTDGTLTQAQVDKVAGTLERQPPMAGMGGRGGMGGNGIGGGMGGGGGMAMTQSHDAAAKALGMTSDELYAAVQGGKSLAVIAKDHKVSVNTLIKAMVADAEAHLAEAVKAGTMTQPQADTMRSSLTDRITDQVNGVRAGRGMGRDFRGPGGADGAGFAPSYGGTSAGSSGTPLSTT